MGRPLAGRVVDTRGQWVAPRPPVGSDGRDRVTLAEGAVRVSRTPGATSARSGGRASRCGRSTQSIAWPELEAQGLYWIRERPGGLAGVLGAQPAEGAAAGRGRLPQPRTARAQSATSSGPP